MKTWYLSVRANNVCKIRKIRIKCVTDLVENTDALIVITPFPNLETPYGSVTVWTAA